MSYSTNASDSDYVSDRASDESSGYSAQKLPSHLSGYLRTRIVQYLTQADDFSAEIQPSSDQHPLLVCSLGNVSPGI